ncbi:MAG: type IV secretion protein IcmX, partial [Proteobacteria bacterium]|nr:type IV secretion protein IcmX [Pseudomonadota bacterium]
PLMYTTTSNTANNPSSFFSSPIIGGNDDNKNQGLTAQSQAQQAANFVRYVTSAVMPMQKPNRTAYDNLYIKASNPSGNYSQLEQQQAAATLSYYLNNLRVYTAQSSVAISNLYYILSKRMPQNATSSGNNQPTSQALSEFSMATWRLYNPNNGNNQWLAQIDKASPTTVGKEIAALLAEMNYQLYLNRQIQERILLTNSIMILQNAQANQPNPSFDITANSVTNSPNSQ